MLCVQDRNNSVGEDAEKRNSNDEENDRKKGRSGDKTTYTVRSSVSMDTASLDSTHHGSKILKKNVPLENTTLFFWDRGSSYFQK